MMLEVTGESDPLAADRQGLSRMLILVWSCAGHSVCAANSVINELVAEFAPRRAMMSGFLKLKASADECPNANETAGMRGACRADVEFVAPFALANACRHPF
jgi:hypothetical protein